MKAKSILLFLILLTLYGCGNTTSDSTSSSNIIHQSDEESESNSKSEDSVDSLIEGCTSIYLCYEYDIVKEGSNGPLYQLDIDEDMAHFMFRGYTSDGYETREANFVLDKFENIRQLIMQSSPSILDVTNYSDENGKISGTLNPALEIYCNNQTFIIDVEDISDIESAFNELFNASDITYSEDTTNTGSTGYLDNEDGSNDVSDTNSFEKEYSSENSLTNGNTITLTSTVDIRSDMDSSSAKVAVAYSGEEVTIIEIYENSWVKVQYGNKEGYIRTDLLQY